MILTIAISASSGAFAECGGKCTKGGRGSERQDGFPYACRCPNNRRRHLVQRMCGGYNHAHFNASTMDPHRPTPESICWAFKCKPGLGFPAGTVAQAVVIQAATTNADGTTNPAITESRDIENAVDKSRCIPCSGPTQTLSNGVCWEIDCKKENPTECDGSKGTCVVFRGTCMPMCATTRAMMTQVRDLTSITFNVNFSTTRPGTPPITCSPGTYLPARGTACIVCDVNHWCPGGGPWTSDTSIHGRNPCPAARPNSPPGASAETTCAV